MNIKIYKDYQQVSEAVAQIMLELIKSKPAAVICLASGDSPALACELFCQKVKEEDIDTSKLLLVGLDEWVGLAPGTYGSCRNDFQKRIIGPLQLDPSQYHFFDALAINLTAECKKMDEVIQSKGGIDLMVVGVGINGHIGFNEPGVDVLLHSHVINLDVTTLTVGQKYFKEKVALEKGITLGLADLIAARQVVLMANGERKAEVIKRTVEDECSNRFPATILQKHNNAIVVVDEAAAIRLLKTTRE